MNEFDWMVVHSKEVDRHIKKIENGLRGCTLDDLINQCEQSINTRTRLIKQSSKLVRYNMLMSMYEEEYKQIPFFKRIFTPKRKRII
jgi:hypothetical protein